MRTVDEARKLGRAFRLGLAFGKGKSMSRSLAQDSEKGNDEVAKDAAIALALYEFSDLEIEKP